MIVCRQLIAAFSAEAYFFAVKGAAPFSNKACNKEEQVSKLKMEEEEGNTQVDLEE